MLQVIWVVCGVVIVTAAVRVRRHSEALRLGRIGFAFLYLVAGAAVNTFFLLRGDNYAEFASESYIPFVRDTWESLVVPNVEIWIGLLILFEASVGVLALLGGRRTQLAYEAAIAFHIALCSFGWGFYLWAVPMIAALTRLLRAERQVAMDSSPHQLRPTGRAIPSAV